MNQRNFLPIHDIDLEQRSLLLQDNLDHCQYCDGIYQADFIIHFDDGRICGACFEKGKYPETTNEQVFEERVRIEEKRNLSQ